MTCPCLRASDFRSPSPISARLYIYTHIYIYIYIYLCCIYCIYAPFQTVPNILYILARRRGGGGGKQPKINGTYGGKSSCGITRSIEYIYVPSYRTWFWRLPHGPAGICSEEIHKFVFPAFISLRIRIEGAPQSVLGYSYPPESVETWQPFFPST